jgi:hypothetical protein
MGYPLVPLMSFYAATMLYASPFRKLAFDWPPDGVCLGKFLLSGLSDHILEQLKIGRDQ